MGKHVIIIASGETERRSLPHLVKHLQDSEGISVDDIRIPPRHRRLDVPMVERLLKAAWYERRDFAPPDKFVILLDADGKPPTQVKQPFQEQLPARIAATSQAAIQIVCAQWHLEAWYFADPAGLKNHLGRGLGSIDPSKPDQIQNPKLHLKHLLAGNAYTAVISESISQAISPAVIAQHSPSFREFLDGVRNGNPSQGTQ